MFYVYTLKNIPGKLYKRIYYSIKESGGFTLLEVLFSLFTMVAAIIGVFSLAQQTISFLPISGQRLVASYLAQEGIEIVRNLRDTNKLKQTIDWRQGLTACASGCEADYSSQSLTPWTGQGQYFYNDGNFYSYTVGPANQKTSYQRKIIIDTSLDPDILKVTSQVFWSEKGRSHSFSATEKLYNWMK